MFKKNTLITALLAAGAMTASADSFTLKNVVSDFGICVDAGLTVTITSGDGQQHTYVSDGTFVGTDAAADMIFNLGTTNEITVTTDGYIRNLYLDYTAATSFEVGALPRVEVLNLSYTNMTELNLTKLPELQTLILDANTKIERLDLTKQTKLRKLHTSGCSSLKEVVLNTTALTDFWADNCKLSGTLDLSKQNHLRCLNVSANNYIYGHLDHVLLSNTDAAKKALDYVNLSMNYLFFDSFPTVYDKVAKEYTVISSLDKQKLFHYVDYFLPGQQYDISDLIRYNAWGVAIGPKVELYRMTKPGDYTPVAENLLVEGTDYTKVGSYKYTFLTEQPRVFFRVSSDLYPDLTLITSPFGITSDPDGISTVIRDTDDAAPAYDLHGRPVGARQTLEPAGLIIKNGKKVITK